MFRGGHVTGQFELTGPEEAMSGGHSSILGAGDLDRFRGSLSHVLVTVLRPDGNLSRPVLHHGDRGAQHPINGLENLPLDQPRDSGMVVVTGNAESSRLERGLAGRRRSLPPSPGATSIRCLRLSSRVRRASNVSRSRYIWPPKPSPCRFPGRPFRSPPSLSESPAISDRGRPRFRRRWTRASCA